MRLDGSLSTGAPPVAKRTVLNSIAWDRTDDWLLCRIAPNAGPRVSEIITLVLGNEFYCPEIQTRVVLNGRPEIVYREILPTYGFLRWSDPKRPLRADEIREHCSGFGVIVTRLANGKKAGARDDEDSELRAPVMVKNADVVELLVQSASGAMVKATNSITESLLGTEIQIPYGPFVSYTGRITKFKGTIVYVILRILGKDVWLKFPQNELFPNLDFEA